MPDLTELVDPAKLAEMRALAGVSAPPAAPPAADAAFEVKGPDNGVGMEHKSDSAAAQVLTVDDETGVVEALVSVTGIEDRVKDVIEVGAYTKTLATREPIGVWSHDDKTWVARTEEARELLPGDPMLRDVKTMDGQPWPLEAGAVYVKSRFNLETPHGAAAYSDVKFFKGKTGWSIGYRATKSHRNPRTGVRHIKELDWYEFSPVMVGAASQPLTLSVKSMSGAHTVDPDDPTGIADDDMLETLQAHELKALWELKESLGLEVKDIVRTPAGARRFGQPIGTKIVKDVVPASALKVGDYVDFQGMGPGGPSDPVPVKGNIQAVEKDSGAVTITVNGEDHKLLPNVKMEITRADGPAEPQVDAPPKKAAGPISNSELQKLYGEAETDEQRALIREALARPPEERREFLAGATGGGAPAPKDKVSGGLGNPGMDKPDPDPAAPKSPNVSERDAAAAGGAPKEFQTTTAAELRGELRRGTTPEREKAIKAELERRGTSGDKAAAAAPRKIAGKVAGDDIENMSVEDLKKKLAAIDPDGPDAARYDELQSALGKKQKAERDATPNTPAKAGPQGPGGPAKKPEGVAANVAAARAAESTKPRPSKAERAAERAAGRAAKPAGGYIGAGDPKDLDDDTLRQQASVLRADSGTPYTPKEKAILAEADRRFAPDFADDDAVAVRKDLGHDVEDILDGMGEARVEDGSKERWSGDLDDARSIAIDLQDGKPVSDDDLRQLRTILDDNQAYGSSPELLTAIDELLASGAKPASAKRQRENAKDRSRRLDLEADQRVNERAKLAALNKRRRAKGQPPLLKLPPEAKGLESVDLLEVVTDTLEVKGSTASLDRSPRSNWVEKAGELPPYIREVARGIERGGHTLSKAIEIAIGRIKKWAAGVGGVKPDTVAKAQAAVAAWEALKAKNAMKFDSELLEHLEFKATYELDQIEDAWGTLYELGAISAVLEGKAEFHEEPLTVDPMTGEDIAPAEEEAEVVDVDLDDVKALFAKGLELKERTYDRDESGKFDGDGKSPAGTAHASREEGGKGKDGGKDGGRKKAEDYKVEGLDDVRRLIRNWDEVPRATKAALKRKLLAVAEREDAPPRLLALVKGLGDGDGVREPGEGSAAAVRSGNAGDWLAQQREKRGEKADDAPLEVDELTRLRELKALL